MPALPNQTPNQDEAASQHPRKVCHGSRIVVEANDTIYNYVQDFIDGKITRAAFWELARFKHPTHQICFCTERSLETLEFAGAEEVYDD